MSTIHMAGPYVVDETGRCALPETIEKRRTPFGEDNSLAQFIRGSLYGEDHTDEQIEVWIRTSAAVQDEESTISAHHDRLVKFITSLGY